MKQRRDRPRPDAPHTGTPGIPWLLGTLAAGVVAGLVARPAAWHAALVSPPWMPPAWTVASLSFVTYLLMGSAAWLVWGERARPGAAAALALYLAQLACNVLWSFLFFGTRQIDLAMLDLAVLWVLVALTMRAFHLLRPLAGWLLVPYLGWVTFAATLNLWIWLRN